MPLKDLKILRTALRQPGPVSVAVRLSLLLVTIGVIVGSGIRAGSGSTNRRLESGVNSTSTSFQSRPLEAPENLYGKTLSPPALVAPDPNEAEQGDSQVILLTLRPNGFEPNDITIPAGNYLVVVRNRTGLPQFSIRLERSTGARLHDVRLPRYKRDWKQYLQLTPDTYLITETDHPDWVCLITVTAK